MILQPIPTETVEFNEKFEFKVLSESGKTYKTVIVRDGLMDNLIVLRDQEDIEYSRCTCQSFVMAKKPICKHMEGVIKYLNSLQVEIRLGGTIEQTRQK